jgi:hypothetical protein
VTASHRYSKFGPDRRVKRFLFGCMAAALALWAAACFDTNNRVHPTADAGFRSFLGITFGDDLRSVEAYYPNGIKETSPLGYPSYHITKAFSDGIAYPDVIYEFDGSNGMQVVVARFDPSSADAVLERLRRILGEPTQHTLNKEEMMDVALWMVPNGEEVRFDRARRLLTVLGPQGHNLRKDLQLRIENSAAVL